MQPVHVPTFGSNGVRRSFVLGAIALVAMSVAACGQGASSDATAAVDPTPATTDVPFGLVDAVVAEQLATDPDIVIVDVRTPPEFAEGHLGRAIEIDFNADDFATRIDELDPAATYLVYCRSGSRSANATAMMRSVGIDRIYELDGGIVAWTEAGLDVVTPD